jgi:hypothetical protein
MQESLVGIDIMLLPLARQHSVVSAHTASAQGMIVRHVDLFICTVDSPSQTKAAVCLTYNVYIQNRNSWWQRGNKS